MFRPEVYADHDGDAGDGEQERAFHEVGSEHQRGTTSHGRSGLLLLAVEPVTRTDGSPDQGDEQEVGIRGRHCIESVCLNLYLVGFNLRLFVIAFMPSVIAHKKTSML